MDFIQIWNRQAPISGPTECCQVIHSVAKTNIIQNTINIITSSYKFSIQFYTLRDCLLTRGIFGGKNIVYQSNKLNRFTINYRFLR